MYNYYQEGRPALFAPAVLVLQRHASYIREGARDPFISYEQFCARMRMATVFNDAAALLQHKLYRLSGHPAYQR